MGNSLSVQGTKKRQCIRNTLRYVLFAILAFCCSQVSAGDVAKASNIVVIVPKDSSVEVLSKASLRAIFGMRKRTWRDGTAIKVFVLDDENPAHIEFSKKVLQTFPYNLRRIWERQVYSGTGQAPINVSSQEEMQNAIATTRNSIGYIRSKWLNDQVKVVDIQ